MSSTKERKRIFLEQQELRRKEREAEWINRITRPPRPCAPPEKPKDGRGSPEAVERRMKAVREDKWKKEKLEREALGHGDEHMTITEIASALQLRHEVVLETLHSAMAKIRVANLGVMEWTEPVRQDLRGLLMWKVVNNEDPTIRARRISLRANLHYMRGRSYRSAIIGKPGRIQQWHALMHAFKAGMSKLKEEQKSEKRKRNNPEGPAEHPPGRRKQAVRCGGGQHRMGESGGDDGQLR
jgi:hypothetical protein